ncbi:MAG: site-specific DNA-methyltransferase [SAR324 cluster bacterium]|uniref:Methyltransferase n=1 Tax=SAR324 cluster bacterium TaxID=2024889 RepID=A0A2A4SX84_9DELT|nr:MAG: site-specific DNA-methyltransferase [SAR324 cluster bacterium]
MNEAIKTEITPTPSNQIRLISGDALAELKKFPDNYFQTCITSPPYWGLRDYGIKGQIGAELSVEEYIQNIQVVFREVYRTLKDDGTLWLNIGDSYTSGGRTWRDADKKNPARGMSYRAPTPEGLKPKDLIGVPWKLAFALQKDGWYLRSDIIWYKPNCQPESVKDRPTRSHEYVFLFSKNERYFYDHLAIKEPTEDGKRLRNKRTVWSVNTEPYKGAHFAVFPRELVTQCLLAGSKENTVVLDPFLGSGTVAQVCLENNRNCVGIELNPEFSDLAKSRVAHAENLNNQLNIEQFVKS